MSSFFTVIKNATSALSKKMKLFIKTRSKKVSRAEHPMIACLENIYGIVKGLSHLARSDCFKCLL